MDEQELKHVVEAALLAAGHPLTLDKLLELFTSKGVEADRATVRTALDALTADYAERGLEVKEIASGYRIQVRASMQDWLQPLFEERAPRYTRALLETLALIAYRQPITRAEIEEVRGVAVSSNIVRTLMERGWVRVVGYRDVPGKPSMLGTTREFLDYFGLKRLEDLPPLAEIKDGMPMNPQSDFLDSLESFEAGVQVPVDGAGQPEEAAVAADDDSAQDEAVAAGAPEDAAESAAEPVPEAVPAAGEAAANDSAEALPETVAAAADDAGEAGSESVVTLPDASAEAASPPVTAVSDTSAEGQPDRVAAAPDDSAESPRPPVTAVSDTSAEGRPDDVAASPDASAEAPTEAVAAGPDDSAEASPETDAEERAESPLEDEVLPRAQNESS